MTIPQGVGLVEYFPENRIEGWQDVSYDQNTVIEEVRKERRRELCIEGHRWFDLRRYAVCRKAPLRKAIERVFAVYDWDSKMKFMRGLKSSYNNLIMRCIFKFT